MSARRELLGRPMRSGPGPVAVCLAAFALTAAGMGVMAADGGPRPAVAAPNATTGDVVIVNETGAMLTGQVTVADDDTVGTALIEYRVNSTNGEWQRSQPRNFSAADRSTPQWWFEWNVSGLQSGTTYEYRVLTETSNGSDAGTVRTFTTNDSGDGPTPTRTPTPLPCPQYRGGASSLCTTTPTPTPDDTSSGASPGTASSGDGGDLDDWLAGLAPLLSWVALVAILAPVVLGGLLVLLPGRAGDDS